MLWPKATSSPEQPRNDAGLLVGEVDERRRAARRLVRRSDVRVVVPQVAGDRVDHLIGALGAAGAVEEGEPALQGGEAGANGGDVEQRGTHDRSSPLTVQ